MMKHRNDIDGLRAFAIVPVVLFHYGLTKIAPGGFVGVDIFFVISGFLITRNIDDTINNGTYSVLDFYNRRIRRIFPALFAMFAFCAICSLLIEFPQEAKSTNQGILASIFFVSNILFFKTSSYFNEALQGNPLLHTWSLSVEEQFYVVVPFFLFAIRNLQKRIKSALVFLVLILSFLLSTYAVYHDKTAAFYLVQNRAWELLIGSVLALDTIPLASRRITAEILGAAGLLLIVGSVVLLNSNSLFPGPGALGPCLGAALILYSGTSHKTLTAWLLALAPLRAIGLVSYSFYLWHWPVYVFYGLLYNTPHGSAKITLIAVAFLLAVISWRFVERPFRTKPFRLDARGTIGAGLAVMALMSLFAFVATPLNSALWRYPPQAIKMLAFLHYPATSMREGTCFLTSGNNGKPFDVKTCLQSDPDKMNYLLVGDSHAADLWSGLSADNPDVNFLQANASLCKPTIGSGGEKRCTDLMKFIFNDFIPKHHFDGIILSANWNNGDIEPALKTALALRPYATQVIIFGPSAVYDLPLPRILALSILHNKPELVARHLLPDQKITDAEFSRRAEQAGVTYVSVYSAMCPNSKCIVEAANNTPLQFDSDHFTAEGAKLVASRITLAPAAVASPR